MSHSSPNLRQSEEYACLLKKKGNTEFDDMRGGGEIGAFVLSKKNINMVKLQIFQYIQSCSGFAGMYRVGLSIHANKPEILILASDFGNDTI